MATARNTLAVAIKLDGTAQAKKDLEDVGKAGEKAFAQIAAAANKVAPGLGNKLQAALRNIRGQFIALQAAGARLAQSFSTFALATNTFGRAIQNSATKVGLLTTVISGAVGALALFFKRAGDNAQQITGQAEALGISAQAYQTYQSAVTSAGLSQEQFDQILSRFFVNAAEGGDALSGAAGDANKLAQSIRQVTVTAADGTQKLITVRGTSDAFAKSVKTIGDASKGGEQALDAFARKIELLKTSQERLNAVIDAGFSKKSAPAVVRALLAIARDADPAARALNKIVEPLSSAQLGPLLDINAAFDRLFKNLFRVKDQVASIFGPAVSGLLNGLADAIFENQKAIKEWADTIAHDALGVVKDLFALLKGQDDKVQNKGLISFRDTVIQIGTTVTTIFKNVVIPAFLAIVNAADQVAAAINSVFGTKFSGLGLIASAVLLQITGGFKVLISTLALALSGVQLLKDALAFVGIRASLTGLVSLIARISTLLTGLLVANPLLAGVLLIAGGLAIVASRESDAQIAAERHAQALAELQAAIADVAAGVPGAAFKLELLKEKHLEVARAAIASAQAQVRAAQAALATLPQPGQNQGKGQFLARVDETNKLNAALQELARRKDDLAQLQATIDGTAQKLQPVTQAAEQLGQKFDQTAQQAETLSSNVRKVDPAFTEAAIAARKLQQQLESTPQAAANISKPFEEAQTQIIQTINDTKSSVLALWSGMVSAMSSQFQSLVGVVQSVAAQIEATLSQITASIASAKSQSITSDSGFKATPLSRAGGGMVRGPGTGTSDSILTWLSDGEFVIRAAAVRKWGVSMLNALNHGSFIAGARGLANGGLAGAVAGGLSVELPRLSLGPIDERSAAVATLQPVTFVLDGQRVDGFSAAPGAVGELMRASTQKRIRSNGRKPGWYGGPI